MVFQKSTKSANEKWVPINIFKLQVADYTVLCYTIPMTYISRSIEPVVRELAGAYPVITMTGPRQSGKTTLCRKIFAHKPYANLESPQVRQFAIEDPKGFLSQYPHGAVLDEIQRAPALVSDIQVLIDEDPRQGLFILTGSQQFEVTNRINQSLAGRTALVKLMPFSLPEIEAGYGLPGIDRLIYHGFYPRLWDQGLDPTQALSAYFETYVERDLRQLALIKDLYLFQRFVQLCAGRIGQLLNLSSLANDGGISHTTAGNWLSLLEASYILFRLPPYFPNTSKRLVKSPKLFFYDVGLAAFLLGIETKDHLKSHPLRGSLFENLVIAEALKFRLNQGKRSNLYFYRDSKGNEVDLLLIQGADIFPIEIKAGMTINRDYFKGLRHFVKRFPDQVPRGSGLVYAGDQAQQRTDIAVVPLKQLYDLFVR